MSKNTGARGLRALLESILTEAMFEVLNSLLILIYLSETVIILYRFLLTHTMLMCTRFLILRQEVIELMQLLLMKSQ